MRISSIASIVLVLRWVLLFSMLFHAAHFVIPVKIGLVGSGILPVVKALLTHRDAAPTQ